jgi:hypothetical protein
MWIDTLLQQIELRCLLKLIESPVLFNQISQLGRHTVEALDHFTYFITVFVFNLNAKLMITNLR